MVDQLSPLEPVLRPGSHGNFADGVGVTLSETQPGSIVQVAAWPGQEKRADRGDQAASTGLALPDGAGGGVCDRRQGRVRLRAGQVPRRRSRRKAWPRPSPQAVAATIGTVTDLSHGRTAHPHRRAEGRMGAGEILRHRLRAAGLPGRLGPARPCHHDIFAQIQRTGADQFDLYVFRSFARAFWTCALPRQRRGRLRGQVTAEPASSHEPL